MDSSGTPRKIVHIDMDAFYASVEQRDNPELRGRPLAVGYGEARGVVAAASYEARAFGVYSAMPSVTAKRKCPDLIFVPPRFDVYKAVSLQIREIFAEYTPLIEPLSLDEAYLDVTENLKGMEIATEVAEQIRARIKAETGLTASAGVSYNKFLAKMASDQRKPDGLFVITPKSGKTVTLKVKWDDFTQMTRSKTVVTPVASAAEIAEIVDLLVSPIFPVQRGIRLLGVTLSSLDAVEEESQPQLALAL
jgi:DNA polymerase-4